MVVRSRKLICPSCPSVCLFPGPAAYSSFSTNQRTHAGFVGGVVGGLSGTIPTEVGLLTEVKWLYAPLADGCSGPVAEGASMEVVRTRKLRCRGPF
jgi:hypothetical protein